jgi:toxin ParE1/3/4
MKLRWRLRAERQFKSQLEYLRKANPVAMKRMRARVKQRLSRPLQFPETGRPTKDSSVYELVIAGTPFIAVYQIEDDAITILGLFHTSQNR